jgi:hypothetical protein
MAVALQAHLRVDIAKQRVVEIFGAADQHAADGRLPVAFQITRFCCVHPVPPLLELPRQHVTRDGAFGEALRRRFETSLCARLLNLQRALDRLHDS